MSKGIIYHSPIQRQKSLTILQRIASKDESVIEDRVNTYGKLIWALAKKHSSSAEEAENAVLQIFKDIWKNASQYNSAKETEKKYILQLAFRRLNKQSLDGLLYKSACSSQALPDFAVLQPE